MSKKKKKSSKRTDELVTLATNNSPAATQDAQQPIQASATNDMNESTETIAAAEQAGEPAVAEAEPILFQQAPSTPPAQTTRESLGQRLRAAREARSWTCADVAKRLHLPVQIVQTLEADRFDSIGHRIYLRGYLTNYVRLLDLPTVLVETVMQQHLEPPPLTTSGTISHSRYLFQRYSVSALYVILTGVIIVPAVLLAMRAGLEPKITELTSLDAPNSAVVADTGKSGATAEASLPAQANPSSEAAAVPATASPVAAAADSPLSASMAPFPTLAHKETAAAQPVAAPTRTGAHSLRLSLKEASWVEVTSASGEKLEYGLLPAGTVKTINSDSALEVRIGNSSGAEVELDGEVQDLAAYRHSNVAHFKAFSGDKPISPY